MKKKKIVLMFVIIMIFVSFLSFNVFAESNGTRIQIDSPKITETKRNEMMIRGWTMSDIKDRTIEIYIDDKKVENVESEERSDVIKAIEGYGGIENNPTPGFKAYYDSRNLTAGSHKVTVKVIDNITNTVIKEESKTFEVQEYNSRIQIDSPKITETKRNEMMIRGWTMSDIKDRTIEIYVDDKKVENVDSEERSDVIEAIEGYGGIENNPTPGFKAYYDSRNLTAGSHKVTVKVIDNITNTVIKEEYKTFEVQEYNSRIQIDSPKITETKRNEMMIRGWTMSDMKDRTIEIYIDDKKVENVESEERSDVIKAIEGYGGIENNPTPGFKAYYDSRNLTAGSHKVTVKVIDNITNTVIKEEYKTFEVQEYNSRIQIDSPKITETKRNEMMIRGWTMSDSKDKTIEIYVDDKKVENVESEERSDVIKAIEGYGGIENNPTPGFKAYYDSRNLKAGSHKVTVKVIDNITNTVIKEETKTFEVQEYNSRIQIDSPKSYSSGATITIRGWTMSDSKDRTIEIYVDDKKVENVESEERSDVIEAIDGYGGIENNPTPGFKAILNSTSIKDGNHNVKVIIRDLYTNEIINSAIKSFILKKYNGRVIIDSPKNSNFKDSIFVRGWALTEVDGSYIKMYIDGIEVSSSINRVVRQDVLDSVTEFGDATVNPLPGYETNIDVSDLNDGKHTLTVKVYTKYNDDVDTKQKVFYKYSNVSTGIDVSKYQGNINWNSVRNDGIAFAFVRAGNRGYGTGLIVEDPYFKNNVINASNVGVKVGVYFYSQAINEAEAIEEARFVTDKLLMYGLQPRISLPIVIDVEYATSQHNGRADNLTKQERTNVVRAFANYIKGMGYEPMVYASKDFLYNNLDMSQLSDLNVWLAHYKSTEDPMSNMSDYTGIYQVWQYTSSGTVNGISGNVDMNISFSNY